MCGKRLRPMIPALLPSLERHGRVALDPTTRGRVLRVSAATIDRLLADVRAMAGLGRRRPAGFGSSVRRSVPVRTFNDWGSPDPGFVEVDFVAHGGTTVSGAYAQTMVLTGIATGWTECIALVLREAGLVVAALERARALFPFPLRGVDFDNDALFMNDVVVGWCRGEGLEVTRSRAYRKNDQAWVEQKNGAIVRRLVGYGRFEGALTGECLSRLYRAARPHGNLFQPSFKLREKRRGGSRVIKRYDVPTPPAVRALAHPAMSEADKTRLRAMLAAADPVLLLAEMRAAQQALGQRVDERGARSTRAAAPAPIDLAQFASDLKVAWASGERRPTHRRQYVRRKLTKRATMLDDVRAQLLAWLEAHPSLPAIEALSRLRTLHPNRFGAAQLRTLQRFMRTQRGEAAQAMLSGPAMAECAALPTSDTTMPGNISA